MTEIEKKAEEYMSKNVSTKCYKNFSEELEERIKKVEEAYKAGYEQGQNETEEKIFNEWCKGESPYPNACGFLLKLQKENEELKAQIPHYTDAALQVPTEPGWYLGYCYGEDETPEDAGVAMVCWDGTKWHGELDLQVTVLQWTFIPKPEVKA